MDQQRDDGLLQEKNMPLKEMPFSKELLACLEKLGAEDLNDLIDLKEENFDILPFNREEYVNEIKAALPFLFDEETRKPNLESLKSIPLSSIGLSARPYHVLSKTGITNAYGLISHPIDYFESLPGLGKGSIEEIRMFILAFVGNMKDSKKNLLAYFYNPEDIHLYDGYVCLNDSRLCVFDEKLDSVLEDCPSRFVLQRHGFHRIHDLLSYGIEKIFFLDGMGKTKCEKTKDVISSYIQDNILLKPSVERMMLEKEKKRIVSLLKKDPGLGLLKEDLFRKCDEKEDALTETALADLKKEGQIDVSIQGRILFHFSSFRELLKSYQDDCLKDTIYRRLQGKTLEELGNDEGVTRERIRQKIEMFLRRHCQGKLFLEDRYQHFFRTYHTDEKSFVDVTKTDAFTYHYLQLRYEKGQKKLDEAFHDEGILLEIRENILEEGYANLIRIGNDYVIHRRIDLFDYYISHNCFKSMSCQDIVSGYNAFASQFDDSLLYANPRSLENKLANHPHMLFSGHHRFRYYDYSSFDFEKLLKEIDLKKYHDCFFSSEYFFRSNPLLMKEYDIRDKNELFSVLKRLYKDEKDIYFKDMPFFIIGNFDRHSYLLGILKEYGELTSKQFNEILDERLGISTQAPFWILEMREYCPQRGVFVYGHASLDHSEEIKALQGKLKEDFYFKDELSCFLPGKDVQSISMVVFKSLGYVSYSNYIIKDGYDAKSYFEHVLCKDDIIPKDVIDRYKSLNSFSFVFYRMKQDFDIIESDEDSYISISYLRKKGYEKEDIQDFLNEVYQKMDEDYFTLRNVREKGIQSRLFSLNMKDIFFESLLKLDERFSYACVYHQSIFKKQKGSFTRKTFLYDIISRFDGISYQDLSSYLSERYGISLSKDKVDEFLVYHDAYYDRNSKRYFKNLETYVQLEMKQKEEQKSQ